MARMSTDRTVVHWLKQFTQEALQAVITLNSELLYEQIERLGLSRLTIDVDGTVICISGKVAWAFRGFGAIVSSFMRNPIGPTSNRQAG
jgi:hypothetical protein